MDKKKAFYNLLQFKIHLGIQFILGVCFIALGYFIYVTQLGFLIEDIKRQGMQQADMVAEASVSSMQRESYFILEDLAAKVEYSPLVAYCQILNAAGKSVLQGHVRPGLTREDVSRAYTADDVAVVTKEIVYNGKPLGSVKLGMFISKAKSEVQTTTVKLIAAFAAVLGIIAIFLYIFLNKLLILPVVNLSLLTEALSRGEFVTTNLDRRQDELGILAQGFNNMSRNLKELYRTMEKKVDARTEDLNNAYHELEAIFDNSLVGIAVLAADHRVIRANNRFANIFGYAAEEMPRISPEKFHTSAHDFDVFVEKFYNRLGETEIAQLEYQFRRKSGAVFWSQVSAKAVDPDDLSKGVVFILEDISERKKASELLRQHAEELRIAKDDADKATRSKSEFLARMSHEIRTPMNAILGMAEMLQESGLSEEQNEYVKTFSTAGELLLGIINDILDFSKIEVGQIKLESISFNLRTLVGDIVKLFSYRAEEKGLFLQQSVDKVLAQKYIGDPTRLRQIIINLIGNAIKFTSTGGVTLSVEESAMDDGAPCCLFQVRDTGIGIPESKLGTIFESFAQADTSTTREFGGTGLGLAISKKLVELMGGEIWVESSPGNGTTFFIKIPLIPDFQVQPAEVRPVLPAGTKILVLEDKSSGRLAAQIRGWGGAVTVKHSPAEAIDLMSHSSGDMAFHAAVVDSRVEKEDGFDVVQLLMGQGINLPPVLLLVASRDVLSELPSPTEIGSLCYILKADAESALQSKLLDALAEGKKTTRVQERGSGWKILLVDDVEANRRVVDLFLKNTNVEITHAENGKIAVEKFIEGDYDLVLMDMEMPVMDGLDATRKIRLWEKEKREYLTPVVALTAHAFEEHQKKTADAGCTEFLAKPIKKQALLDIIERFAGKRELLAPPPVEVQEDIATEEDALFADELDSPVQIDPELEDLRPLFLRTMKDFQIQMSEAVKAGDYPTLQRCGHSLKGLGNTYAVEEISQTGKIIETAARARQTAVVVEAIKHLGVFMSTGKAPRIQSVQPDGECASPLDEPVQNQDGRYTVRVSSEMTELIPFLMDAMRKDLELMYNALKQKDFSTLKRFGHSHKGFGSTYGFDYISSVGAKIECTAEGRNADEMADLLVKLTNYLERLDIVFESRQELVEEPVEEPVPGHAEVDVTQAPVEENHVVEVDPELFELVPLFMETMNSNIQEMQEAILTQNYDIICRHGHSQKGLGSTYGFDYLGHLGYRIETAAMQKNIDEISVLLLEMETYLAKVQIVQRKG